MMSSRKRRKNTVALSSRFLFGLLAVAVLFASIEPAHSEEPSARMRYQLEPTGHYTIKVTTTLLIKGEKTSVSAYVRCNSFNYVGPEELPRFRAFIEDGVIDAEFPDGSAIRIDHFAPSAKGGEPKSCP